MGKQMQFELWQECGNNCPFCYLSAENNKFTPDKVKLHSLNRSLEKISDMTNYPEYDTIAYIGGEFFQGQLRTLEVRKKFFELMKKTADLLRDGYIKNVWIYATMTIGNQKDLYDTLELFEKKEGLWILTSYDSVGRFHTPKMFETWDSTLLKIHELYPEVKFNITSILTGDLIEKYLSGELDFNKMKERYHSTMFFKQCGSLFDIRKVLDHRERMNKIVPNFYPKRDEFLKFLIKFKNDMGIDEYDKLYNINYRADELYRNYNDDETKLIKRDKHSPVENDDPLNYVFNKCGHMTLYQAYIDSDECIMCDKEMIRNMV